MMTYVPANVRLRAGLIVLLIGFAASLLAAFAPSAFAATAFAQGVQILVVIAAAAGGGNSRTVRAQEVLEVIRELLEPSRAPDKALGIGRDKC